MSDIIIRLKKINGQINGIQKMIERKDQCNKIIIQFQAVKAALNSAFSKMINDNLNNCIANHKNEEIEKMINLIIKK